MSKTETMKIRLHNIKWDSYFDKYPQILDTLPKEKVKEIASRKSYMTMIPIYTY